MKTAIQLRKTRPVAYLIYMCQVENLIRACHLNIDEIEEKVLPDYDFSEPPYMEEVRQWYEDLIRMMREENATELPCHLQIVKNVVQMLEEHQEKVLAEGKDWEFAKMCATVKDFLRRFRESKGFTEDRGNVIQSVEFVYSYAIQKNVQKMDMTPQSEEAAKYLTDYLEKLESSYIAEKEENA